jgi:hypothetical protein
MSNTVYDSKPNDKRAPGWRSRKIIMEAYSRGRACPALVLGVITRRAGILQGGASPAPTFYFSS